MKSLKSHLLLFIVLSLSFLKVNGQNYEKSISTYFVFKNKDTAYTFLNKNYLKAKADDKSQTIAVLNIGEELIIESNDEETNSDGKIIPLFLKVKFKGKDGYINIESIASKKLSYYPRNTYFLFKIKLNKDSADELLMREVYTNTIVNESTTPLWGDMFDLYLSDSKGLDSIDCLIVLDYLSEACGAEGGITYFSWTPQKIKLLAHLSHVGDADVYYIFEDLIFPADSGGTKGKLIFKSEVYELMDYETNWHKETKEERIYFWISGQIVPEFKSKPLDE